MTLLLILIFVAAIIVNYFNTKVALLIALGGLLLPLCIELLSK